MRLGICGNGKIVRSCLETLRFVEGIETAAICVRPQSLEKGEALSVEFGIPRVYTDYGAMLRGGEIDTVYIGIVNRLHHSYAMGAMRAGIHVILEKPFTPTAAEARELAAFSRERGLFLLEAITNQYNRNYLLIRECLPELGPVKLVQCNYSQYSSRYDAYLKGEVHAAFDPAGYGGALYDIGIYNLHFVVGLFGAPERVSYKANLGWNGVDTSGTAILEYPGFHALCTGAKDSDSPCFAIIQGERGWLRVEGSPSFCPELEISIGGRRERFTGYGTDLRMKEELEAFERIIRTGDRKACDEALSHTVRVLEAIEAAMSDLRRRS